MLNLDHTHDPYQNGQLIAEYTETKSNQEAVFRAEQLMKDSSFVAPRRTPHPSRYLRSLISPLFLTDRDKHILPLTKAFVSEQDEVRPSWFGRLTYEFEQLISNVEKVDVKDYGAVGDGVTDDTLAFKEALADGHRQVHVPAGTYLVRGIRLPSYTILTGDGKGQTILKLHDAAPKGRRLITNQNYLLGNHHLLVERMTLDWNIERIGDAKKSSTWGNHSSCLTYAHVTYGWVFDVDAVNPGLHCFDISTPYYNYNGDGARANLSSSFIWFDGLTGSGFGDDGITTHHSDHLFISNCFMHDPSGRAHAAGFSNSNGIEIDDGSRDVWLFNNATTRCFGGLEIKAHATSSAASTVKIVGHLSVDDHRSFNFRHIGHHQATDPTSQTAYNIIATRLIAQTPLYTPLYQNSKPRALIVSAYRNVVIHDFTVLGDPYYDYQEQPMIGIQYKARNVTLSQVKMSGFRQAKTDIQVFGGDNRAEDVRLIDVRIEDSAKHGITIGPNIEHVRLTNVAIKGDGTVGLNAKSEPELERFIATGYKVPVRTHATLS
ncbi:MULTISPECIES: glycosyl hydrolase family 28-related protein [Exiguobacterium]|uniref:glycosyl hydrolase family 28-related protein n=1 Tax=Exiguobacterium TaxID=33986 RepID=UPI001BE6766E|nr:MULTISPECIES: glycosyl hydrolase family 28-related protein [Exiguobacterium]MCT4793455.1 glycoside hydrolase family 55 protein [Exiguobacterium artemiae]